MSATKTFKIGLSNADKATMKNEVIAAVQGDFEEEYAKQDGAYENLWSGNLITDQNRRWVNNFVFGTGTVDTVFNGEATAYAIRGRTEWTGTTPSYVNVVSNKSVIFNLYNPTNHYAHVVESDDGNNGVCVYGTGLTTSDVLEYSADTSFGTITELAITEETNSTGDTYLHATIPADGYVRVKNAEPEDLCIANVWGGNRVNYHPAYEEAVVYFNSATYFATGMKSIHVNGEEVVFDELYANRYFARVLANSFGATPSVSYVAASGTYNIYRATLTNAMNKGACEIGGSTKFAFSDVGAMSSSTAISADTMSLASGYIYFAIAQSEDATYTYSEDATIVDAETFASELAEKGHLYTESDGVYTEATEYTSDTTYYYISATNLHGLNGQAIVDEIKNKVIVYQRHSMDKSTYTGTAISPALDWNYKMGDFGTEELTLADGYPVVPLWVVYYPINVLETVQQLPNNYISADSFLASLNLIGETEGFHADGVEMNEETGNLEPYYIDGSNNKIKGVLDTKETIVNLDTVLYWNASASWYTQELSETDKQKILNIGKSFYKLTSTVFRILTCPVGGTPSSSYSILKFVGAACDASNDIRYATLLFVTYFFPWYISPVQVTINVYSREMKIKPL